MSSNPTATNNDQNNAKNEHTKERKAKKPRTNNRNSGEGPSTTPPAGDGPSGSSPPKNPGGKRRDHRPRAPKKKAITREEHTEMHLAISLADRDSHQGLPFEGVLQECVLCCKVSDLFGIGDCMHQVCMECAIRMRVIQEHRSCPQCRKEIETMYFVKFCGVEWNLQSTAFLDNADTRDFRVKFESEYAKEAYDRYLSHTCQICTNAETRCVVPNFESLRIHYGQKHRLFFCHICTDGLRLFSWERKVYSSESLQMHLKKGDKDDKSLKGHPQCLFCSDRFFDGDAQYRHLRQDHFFCQLCEAEGKANLFYRARTELHAHYAKQHHTCTNADCREMGIVFLNDFDLQVHLAQSHSGGNRHVLPVDFHYNRGAQRRRSPSPNPSSSSAAVGRAFAAIRANAPRTAPMPPPPPVSTVQAFPALSASSSTAAPFRVTPNSARNPANEFPSLPSRPETSQSRKSTLKPLQPTLASIAKGIARPPASAPAPQRPKPVRAPPLPMLVQKKPHPRVRNRHHHDYDDEPPFAPAQPHSKIMMIPATSAPREPQLVRLTSAPVKRIIPIAGKKTINRFSMLNLN